MTPLLKKLIIALVAAVIAAILYLFVLSGDAIPVDPTIDGNSTALQTSEKILANTRKVDGLKFDTTLFQKASFISLKDTRVDLTNDLSTIRTGRPNPFDPLR